jgi:hypothetical protein
MRRSHEMPSTAESGLMREDIAAAFPRRFIRAAFSFPAMLAFGLALVTFLSCRHQFNDPDTWLHLKLGETIWRSRSIPRSDLFSYTTNHHSWTDHEWLGEVMIYAAYKAGGYRGMMLWLCCTASLVFVLVYVLCWLYSGNAKLSMLGGLMGWYFGTVSLTIRPLILGHLFLVMELLLLLLGQSRGRRWFWALPPLFAVWVNCHGSWLLGLLVLAVSVFSSFIELRAGKLVSIRRERPQRVTLCAVSLLCLAALLLNPVGPKLLAYPFNVFIGQADNLANVTEWQPLSLADQRAAGLFAIAGLLGLLFLLRPIELRLEELLFLGIAFGMALRHLRMLFAFGILAAPVVCRLLADLWDSYDPGRDNRVANALLIVVFAAIITAAFPGAADLEEQVRKGNPAEAVEFIRRTGLAGPMLNEYAWGGYLTWALPEQRVFIDPQGEIFDWTGVLREYGLWAGVQEDPARLLDKYGIRYCLIRKSAPMASVLPYLPGWRKVYGGETAVIFFKDDARPR